MLTNPVAGTLTLESMSLELVDVSLEDLPDAEEERGDALLQRIYEYLP